MNLFAMYQRQKKQEMEELREIRRACFQMMRSAEKLAVKQQPKIYLVSSNNLPKPEKTNVVQKFTCLQAN